MTRFLPPLFLAAFRSVAANEFRFAFQTDAASLNVYEGLVGWNDDLQIAPALTGRNHHTQTARDSCVEPLRRSNP